MMMAQNNHRAVAAAVRTSSSASSSSSTMTAYPYKNTMTTPPPQQQVQQQQQESSYNYNNSSSDCYTSELQDLFDQMEHDPRSSTLGVDESYLRQQREEKRLDCGIAESALRFKTTSYGGRLLRAPYVHPNEHRVVMCVSANELGLKTETEKLILQEIVGSRLNTTRQELRLTSNQFGSRIENKRHLVSMLNRIVMSCRRLAGEIASEKDTGKVYNDDDDDNVDQA